MFIQLLENVSINSTSYKGSGLQRHKFFFEEALDARFPLIPLPIKEAVFPG